METESIVQMLQQAQHGNLKTKIVHVPPEWGGRDAGKSFQITEMNAFRAEKWACRAILLLSGSGGFVPESFAGRGMEAIFLVGVNVMLQAPIQFEKLEPLLDEMLSCVRIIRDPKARDRVTGTYIATELQPTDILEVKTIMWLRSEVLAIHTNFSPAEALWKLISGIMTSVASETTSTSRPTSGS